MKKICGLFGFAVLVALMALGLSNSKVNALEEEPIVEQVQTTESTDEVYQSEMSKWYESEIFVYVVSYISAGAGVGTLYAVVRKLALRFMNKVFNEAKNKLKELKELADKASNDLAEAQKKIDAKVEEMNRIEQSIIENNEQANNEIKKIQLAIYYAYTNDEKMVRNGTSVKVSEALNYIGEENEKN